MARVSRQFYADFEGRCYWCGVEYPVNTSIAFCGDQLVHSDCSAAMVLADTEIGAEHA